MPEINPHKLEKEVKKASREIKIDLHKVNTIIGEGTLFRGEFNINGLIRIDGGFEGIIRTDKPILVGATGKVKGDIYAKSAIIGGTVIGNIYAIEKVLLLSTAKVKGDIEASSITIEEGAQFVGKFTRTQQETMEKKFEKEVKPYLMDSTKFFLEDAHL